MKKFKSLIPALLMMLCIGTAYADDLSVEATRFRTSIKQFLREEGFSPVDDDTDVNFKKEGTLYWFSFAGSNPIYVELHRAGIDAEGLNRQTLLEAVNSANSKIPAAKAMLGNTSVSFAVEMYCHSAEEFRYIFYKCMRCLDDSRSEVNDYYNGNSSSSSSSGGYSSGSSSSASGCGALFDKFFPINGVRLGVTTLSQLQSAGYTIETNDSGDRHCTVGGLIFWDFERKDGIIDYVTLRKRNPVPESLQRLGIDWGMSYNQFIAKFKELGFTVTVTEQPTVKEYSGRNTFNAEFKATTPGSNATIRVEFEFGNEHGEGYNANSRNSFYDMIFDTH